MIRLFDQGRQFTAIQIEGQVSSGTLRAELAAANCGPLNTTAEVAHPGESEVDIVVLDDPSTSLMHDHWLHPCQCAGPLLAEVRSPQP